MLCVDLEMDKYKENMDNSRINVFLDFQSVVVPGGGKVRHSPPLKIVLAPSNFSERKIGHFAVQTGQN